MALSSQVGQDGRQWEMAESERQRSGDEDPRHWLQRQRGRGGEAGRKDFSDNFLPNKDQCRCLSPPTPRTTYLRLSERKSRRKLWQRSTLLLCKTSTSPTRWPRKTLKMAFCLDHHEGERVEEEVLNSGQRSCSPRKVYKLHGPGLLPLAEIKFKIKNLLTQLGSCTLRLF